MLGIHNLTVFLISSIFIIMLPGPATLYIVGRSVSQGRRAGVLSVLGISSGSLCHIAAVAFGLSALLAASQMAFTVIRFLGAAYLIYLGFQSLLAKGAVQDKEEVATPNRGFSVYGQGITTQLLNPKASLFFLAILPQFVTPTATHSPLPFLLLGALFVCMDTSWFLCVAMFSAFLTGWLRRSERIQATLRKATGILYIGLGLELLRARFKLVPSR